MIKRILAASVVIAFAVAPAFAQSSASKSDGATDSANAGIPGKWAGPIGEAFYTDATGLALRPKEEALANFSNLTAEQQAQVQNDCAAVAADSQGTDMDPGTTASTTTGETAAESATNRAPAQTATMQTACQWVVTGK
jgi:hypothetical protein